MPELLGVTYMLAKKNNLDSLILLRGIAVLMVCFCHFATAFFSKEYFLEYGKYGVQVFFVISGFVIPYSLHKGNYKLKDYPKFIYKRALRLHPPYLAALGLTLFILFLQQKAHHVSYSENLLSVCKSVIYLHIPYNNPVFWTLIVEGEFYIFIGLFYVLLRKSFKFSIYLIIPCLLLFSRLPVFNSITLCHYINFFLIGIVGFLLFEQLNGQKINILMLSGLLLFTAICNTHAEFILAFGTILFILIYKGKIPKVLTYTGTISYSIYLIHYPLGFLIINVLGRFLPHIPIWLILLMTAAIVIVASSIFYRIFEYYSELLSKKVKYS